VCTENLNRVELVVRCWIDRLNTVIVTRLAGDLLAAKYLLSVDNGARVSPSSHHAISTALSTKGRFDPSSAKLVHHSG
jgi:hypothetical protein